MGVCLGGSSFDLGSDGARFAISDVFSKCAADGYDFLWDDGDLGADGFQRNFLGIGAIEEEFSRAHSECSRRPGPMPSVSINTGTLAANNSSRVWIRRCSGGRRN